MRASTACILLALAHTPAMAQVAPADMDLTIDVLRIEPIQVVQDYDLNVPLLTGKPALVRVYVVPRTNDVRRLSGALTVHHQGTGQTQIVQAENSVAAAALRDRTNAELQSSLPHTLNFVIPPELLVESGVMTLAVHNITADDGSRVRCGNCSTMIRWHPLMRGPTLRLKVFGLRYSYRTSLNMPPTLVEPGPRDIELLHSWLERAFPVSRVELEYLPTNAAYAAPFSCTDANAQLENLRLLDGRPPGVRYYALVGDEWYVMRGCAPVERPMPMVASGPAGNRNVWAVADADGSYADWYGGHEIGHTLGRNHVQGCGEAGPHDADYPKGNGSIAPAIGLDWGRPNDATVPRRLLASDTWFDVMTYCPLVWPSAHSYVRMLQVLLAEESDIRPILASAEEDDTNVADTPLMGPVPAESVLIVIATINMAASSGTIRSLRLERAAASAPPDDSPITLRQVAADGALLSETPLRWRPSTYSDSSDVSGLADGSVALQRGLAAVHLVINGTVAQEIRRSSSAPEITGFQTVAQGPGDDAFLLVSWRATDRDRSRMTYAVQLSIDGEAWKTLAVNLTEPRINLPKSIVPPGSRARVKVIASDGFSSTAAEWVIPPTP